MPIDQKSNGLLKSLVSLIFIYSLFSFKFEIYGDVRIDDVLVILLAIISVFFVIAEYATWNEMFGSKILIFFKIFLLVNIISSFINYFGGRVDFWQAILYSLRHFEYFLYAYLGYILSHCNFNYNLAFRCYIIFVALLVPLQYYGLVPVFSGFTPDRAIGNTGGPWELAVVASFLVIYFAACKQKKYAVISFFVLVLTGSRITISALLMMFIYKSLWYSRRGVGRLLLAVSVLIFVVAFAMMVEYGSYDWVLLNRVKLFFSYDTFNVVMGFFENSISVNTGIEFADLGQSERLNFNLEASGGDQSAFVRFANWAILTKSVIVDFIAIFFGLGPSFAGKAVDGAYIRLFVEVGLIGFFAYCIFIYKMMNSGLGLIFNEYAWIILVSAIFIDVFTTYKIMLIFWVIVGDSMYRINDNKNRRL